MMLTRCGFEAWARGSGWRAKAKPIGPTMCNAHHDAHNQLYQKQYMYKEDAVTYGRARRMPPRPTAGTHVTRRMTRLEGEAGRHRPLVLWTQVQREPPSAAGRGGGKGGGARPNGVAWRDCVAKACVAACEAPHRGPDVVSPL